MDEGLLDAIASGKPLTVEAERVLEQGRKLTCLLTAANTPSIMTMLYDIIEGGETLGADTMAEILRPG